MSHLTVPLYCAGTTAFLFALLLRAIWTSAHTFVAVFLGALIFFAWRTYAETRKNWPAFKAEMRMRTDERRRDAQQKRFRSTELNQYTQPDAGADLPATHRRSGNTECVHNDMPLHLKHFRCGDELVQGLLDRAEIAIESNIAIRRTSSSVGGELEAAQPAEKDQRIPSNLVIPDMHTVNHLSEQFNFNLTGRRSNTRSEGLVAMVSRLEYWARESISYVDQGPFCQQCVGVNEQKKALPLPSVHCLLTNPRFALKSGYLIARRLCLSAQAVNSDADTKCHCAVHVIRHRAPVSRQWANQKIHFYSSDQACPAILTADLSLSKTSLDGEDA